jgi:hypothetical protein
MSDMTKSTGRRSPNLDLWVPALIFLAAVLSLNARLFSHSLYEVSDLAVNALQVQNAKHFRELLGNYSRWNFHHPGPAAFYMLAAGESVFYDTLPVVPAPLNAEFLTVLVFNTGCLFVALGLCRTVCQNALFIPFGLAASLYFVWTINHTVWGGAFVSAWTPHLALFPFLLFLCSCAAVWSTPLRRLPLMAGAGLFLAELHVGLVPFVALLGGAALLGGLRREIRVKSLREILFQHRRALWTSFAIVAVMSSPMIIEAVVHRPNNLSKIASYMRANPGFQRPLIESFQYFLTFPMQIGNPEALVGKVTFSDTLPKYEYVRVYLAFLLGLLVIAAAAGLKTRKRPASFASALLAEIFLASLMFLFWGMKITGDLYNYLGFFIFAIQLLVMWLAIGYVLDQVPLKPNRWVSFGAACLAAAGVLFLGPFIENQYEGEPEVFAIANRLPPHPRLIRVDYPEEDWERVAGVLSWMSRDAKPFCTPAVSEILFGADRVCSDERASSALLFSDQRIGCSSCRTLSDADGWYATFVGTRHISFPLTIGPAVLLDSLRKPAPGSEWRCLESAFRLPESSEVGNDLRLGVETVGVSRGETVSLNGRLLGGDLQPGAFSVPGGTLKAGGENGVEVCGAQPLVPDEPVTLARPPADVVDVTFRSVAKKVGFYEAEANGQWTSGSASLYFSLNDTEAESHFYKLTINGTDLPGRPVEVSLNAHRIGQIVGYIPDGIAFVVGPKTLHAGANELAFMVAAAAPVGNDPRNLGFGFARFRVSPVNNLSAPLAVLAQDTFDAKRGFFGLDGGRRWTGREGVIEFAVSPTPGVESYRLTIDAIVLPGRDVTVLWDGKQLGKLSAKGTTNFQIQAQQFEASGINRVSLVSHGQPRPYGEMGAKLQKVVLAPIRSITLHFTAMADVSR